MKRERTEPEAVRLDAGAWRRVLKWEEEPVLTISLRWPKLDDALPGPRRVGRYYRQVSEQWKTRWEGEFYRQACAAAAAAREASRPFAPWSASLDFTVTHLDGTFLSLYQDAVEDTGDRRPVTVRRGDTWTMPSGTPCSLSSFFPPRSRWRRQVLSELTIQAEKRVSSSPVLSGLAGTSGAGFSSGPFLSYRQRDYTLLSALYACPLRRRDSHLSNCQTRGELLTIFLQNAPCQRDKSAI